MRSSTDMTEKYRKELVMSSLRKKAMLEMSKEMKLEAVFEDAEDECRKTQNLMNRSLNTFLNFAEENGFDRYLMLEAMYQHAACDIYFRGSESTEAVKAEIVERLDGLFEDIDNAESVKSIH